MLIILSLFCIFFAGVTPFILAKKKPFISDRLCAFLHVIGTIFGWTFIFLTYQHHFVVSLELPFKTIFGSFSILIDEITLLFLIPIYTISAMSAIYSISYWSTAKKGYILSVKYRLFLSLFTLFMIFLVIADNFVMFLMCWEIMSLLAYFLITVDEANSEAQSAGYLYIIATHTGIIALFGMFAILQTQFDFFDFSSTVGQVNGNLGIASIIFLLGVFGFGMKAGIFPLYFWLPTAHASAPVAVSALLSGVMIKMGIYGVVRVASLFMNIPHWWGWMVLGLGIISGILGVVYAIAQHDIKKLLAYHSIENIGIIAIGIGLGILGQSYHNETLILFGFAGALFHVINHALFKPLLFYSAGSIIEKYHTRDISHYGGIIKAQPYTALFFLIGAVAISGLPPLNGFASEWLLYMGMFKSILSTQNALVPVFTGIVALSIIGGLALACFVKVFGITFLGKPRKIELLHVRESSWSMLFPMAFLSVICFILGIFPSIMEGLLSYCATLFSHHPLKPQLGIMTELSYAYIWLLGIFLILGVIFLVSFKGKIKKDIDTWACAFPYTTPKMQYTPASLAQMIMYIFNWTLKIKKSELPLSGFFHQKYAFYFHQNDKTIYLLTTLSNIFVLFASKVKTIVHNGYMGIYVLYIFTTLIAMLLYVSH